MQVLLSVQYKEYKQTVAPAYNLPVYIPYIEQTVAPAYNLPVYIPYGIGCGLAGGDWETVEFIIKIIFKDSPVQCIIVNKEY